MSGVAHKTWAPANPLACRREMERAAQALAADQRGPTGEEALAILEQQRREDEAAGMPQAMLHLVVEQ